ncbi:MAG: ATP-binding protein, partial [Bacteroidaceae bacterium]|nr:ATP-binding protein [Bacteroidaceae bacterium]
MAAIIGRKQEQRELSRLYHSGEAEMVVVYGRRRVGKTFLVNQMFAQTGFAFKVTGLYEQKMPIQLTNFYMAIDEYFPDEERKRP